MKRLLIAILLGIFYSTTAKAQSFAVDRISTKDSILLLQFWRDFKRTIDEHDILGLSQNFHFPFYCSPCLDYDSLKETQNSPVTLKVTKALFKKSAYKLFFDLPNKDSYGKKLWLEDFVFMPAVDDNNKSNGFMFGYSISPPSKTWEGSQGFVYLKFVNGKLLIVGLDHVP